MSSAADGTDNAIADASAAATEAISSLAFVDDTVPPCASGAPSSASVPAETIEVGNEELAPAEAEEEDSLTSPLAEAKEKDASTPVFAEVDGEDDMTEGPALEKTETSAPIEAELRGTETSPDATKEEDVNKTSFVADSNEATEESPSLKMERCGSVMIRRRLEVAWLNKFLESKETHAEVAKKQGMESLYELVLDLTNNRVDKDGAAERIRLINKTVDKHPGGKAFVRDSGGLAVALHVMAVCIHDPDVQVAGCELLEKEAEDTDAVQDMVGEVEGIDAILEAMTHHQDIVAVQDAAAFALRSLAWGEGNRKTIVRHGAMHDLVESLRRHTESPLLQEHIICTIAHSVYKNEEGRTTCGKVGAVQAIVNTMKQYPDVVSLQAQCCFALRNLSWECPENTALMLEHSAGDQLLASLIRFPRIPGVQDQALAAMSNFMVRELESVKTALGDERRVVLTVIFNALILFVGNPSIIRHAKLLLVNLADAGKTAGLTTGLKQIATFPDAAKIIMRLISSKETRTISAASNTAKLIKSLAVVDEFQAEVRRRGGISLFLGCLGQFAASDSAKCCNVLEGLNAICSGSDEAKAEFNKVGGVAQIAALMLELPNEDLFQEGCCMVLDNISNGQFEATAENMTDRAEAMRSVVAAMILYPKSAPLQEHACSVMIKVAATSHKDSNSLCALGARLVVEKARAEHSGNPAVESLANQLLTLLVPSGDRSREGRGQTPTGSSSARLRSRSRTVQTGQRSRSRMDRSKSRDRRRGPAFGGLDAVDENSTGDAIVSGGAKPKRRPGSKPEKKGRRAGRANLNCKEPPSTLEAFQEE